MAAPRRSTRLSSSGKATPLPSSEIWHRRQTKSSAVDSDDDDALTVERTWPKAEEKENNENCDNTNKMSRSGLGREKKPSEQLKTPRSSKSTSGRPMPACKKREHSNKRQLESERSNEDEAVGKEVEAQQVSPPKQSRQHKKVLAQHLISPTRLLDRLSIEDRQDDEEAQEKELTDCAVPVAKEVAKEDSQDGPSTPRNKYQNARRVLNSAETNLLPGREKQLNELREFFTESLRDKRSSSLYVSGQPGTGKTACLSLLLRSPEFAERLQCVYINCTSIASIGGVYKKLCAELNLHPAGRTERDCLAALHHHLRTTKRMVLIVLDEIDQLCSARQSVLYTIFEWPSLPGAKLLLVGIANSLDLTARALIRLNARCELKPRLLHFPPYSKQQIVDIFRSRLEEADVLDVFPPVTLQLLAAKVSAVSGDVRRALDIGRRVVEIAEQQKNAGQRQVQLKDLGDLAGDDRITKEAAEEPLRPVQVTQVAAVLNKVYGASQNLQEDIEESFPLQQKIMLCSLLLMLRNERHKDTTMGRLHEVYRRVCTKRNIVSLDQAEFSGLVDLVETRGILRIIRKKEPRLSKVQLQWDEEEVNGALCDKQLIASILNDKTCISGAN